MKKNIFLLVTAILLIGLFYFFNHQQQKTFSVVKTPSSPIKLTGLEIAKRLILYVDTTIKPEGGFIPSLECHKDISSNCIPSESFALGHASSATAPHYGNIIVAYNDYAKKTNDEHYKQIADSQMEWIMKSCDNDANFCLWNFSPLTFYWNINHEEKYKNAMLKAADSLTMDQPLGNYLALNPGSKLKALYMATNDSRYLNLLKNNTDKLISGELDSLVTNPVLYTEDGFALHVLTFKIASSEALSAYAVTKDKKYLDYAINAAKNSKIGEYIGKIPSDKEFGTLTGALDLMLSLESLDPSSKDYYHKNSLSIAQYLVKKYEDTKENPKFNGDNAFINDSKKDTLTNGSMIRQFLKLSDAQFSVR